MPKALNTFHKTVSRCDDMLKMYTHLSNEPQFANSETKDLLRSALSMAVAGMDAYFTDRFTQDIVEYIKEKGATKDMVRILAEAGLDTEQALEMLTMDRPYRRIRTLLDAHLSAYTTQRFHIIDELFAIYKVPKLTENAQGLAKRKELLLSVEHAIERRHVIAHRADCKTNGDPKRIEFVTVENWIKDIKLLVDKCEELIAKVVG